MAQPVVRAAEERGVTEARGTQASSNTVTVLQGAPLSHQTRLVKLFEKYSPEKVANVNYLLERCAGREEELIAAFVAKWGPEPGAPRGNWLATEGKRIAETLASQSRRTALTLIAEAKAAEAKRVVEQQRLADEAAEEMRTSAEAAEALAANEAKAAQEEARRFAEMKAVAEKMAQEKLYEQSRDDRRARVFREAALLKLNIVAQQELSKTSSCARRLPPVVLRPSEAEIAAAKARKEERYQAHDEFLRRRRESERQALREFDKRRQQSLPLPVPKEYNHTQVTLSSSGMKQSRSPPMPSPRDHRLVVARTYNALLKEKERVMLQVQRERVERERGVIINPVDRELQQMEKLERDAERHERSLAAIDALKAKKTADREQKKKVGAARSTLVKSFRLESETLCTTTQLKICENKSALLHARLFEQRAERDSAQAEMDRAQAEADREAALAAVKQAAADKAKGKADRLIERAAVLQAKADMAAARADQAGTKAIRKETNAEIASANAVSKAAQVTAARAAREREKANSFFAKAQLLSERADASKARAATERYQASLLMEEVQRYRESLKGSPKKEDPAILEAKTTFFASQVVDYETEEATERTLLENLATKELIAIQKNALWGKAIIKKAAAKRCAEQQAAEDAAAALPAENQVEESQLKVLRTIFDEIDSDKAGTLDVKKIGVIAQSQNCVMSQANADAAMVALGCPSEPVTLDRFVAWFRKDLVHEGVWLTAVRAWMRKSMPRDEEGQKTLHRVDKGEIVAPLSSSACVPESEMMQIDRLINRLGGDAGNRPNTTITDGGDEIRNVPWKTGYSRDPMNLSLSLSSLRSHERQQIRVNSLADM